MCATIDYLITTIDHLLFAFRVAFNIFSTAEHYGTHMDAPYHFAEHGRKLDQIPLDELHGPLVVIDISSRAQHDHNASVTVDDIKAWEEKNGRIPDHAFVVMDSGWGRYWGDQEQFVAASNENQLGKFPGFSYAATEWLLQNRNNFRGLGVDTLSCDTPPLMSVHIRLLGAEKLCLENVALYNRDVPASGADIFVMPILLKDGTGGPARMFAVWDEAILASEAAYHTPTYISLICGILFGYILNMIL